MIEPSEWWRPFLREGEYYVGDASSIADYVSHDVEPEDMPEEMAHSAILHPDGRREPAPLTHAGWEFFCDLNGPLLWRDEDEGPAPVVITDFAARMKELPTP